MTYDFFLVPVQATSSKSIKVGVTGFKGEQNNEHFCCLYKRFCQVLSIYHVRIKKYTSHNLWEAFEWLSTAWKTPVLQLHGDCHFGPVMWPPVTYQALSTPFRFLGLPFIHIHPSTPSLEICFKYGCQSWSGTICLWASLWGRWRPSQLIQQWLWGWIPVQHKSTVRLPHPSTADRVAMTLGEWCRCGSCTSDGLTDLECICCTEWQLLESRLGADNIKCVTQHQDVATLCLNPVVLLSMWPYIMAFKSLKCPIPRQLTNK